MSRLRNILRIMQNNSVKISVIMPIYNVEEYLPKAVDSILKQTLVDFELFLVDDGSIDDSGKICDKYASQDSRVKVIHQVNSGAHNARNNALKLASGEYVCFFDSDDYIEPDMYELLSNAVEYYGFKMAQISRDEVNENGSKRPDVCIMIPNNKYYY